MKVIILNFKFNSMSNTGNTILGVITGTAIGAALGILFAPEKGEVTRKNIANMASETKKSLEENAIDFKDKMATKIAADTDTLETKVENIVSDVSYKTEDVITALENKLAILKNKNKKLQKTV